MHAKTLPLFLLFATAAALADDALADDAAILQCRALPATAARLACYDAIPVGSAAASANAPAASAAAAGAAPATAAATPEQRFGLGQVKPVAKANEPTSIESTIEGNFNGWGPNTRFKLANGQVWRVIDGSSAELGPVKNQQVRIVRNIFGTMFLEVAGSNNSAKVRRLQ